MIVRIQALGSRVQAFTRARNGAVGLWMAVAILPITLLVGAAADLRRVETLRGAVQDASDAAVLAAAKAYAAGGSTPDSQIAAAQAAAGRSLQGNLEAVREKLSGLEWQVLRDPGGAGELVLVTRARVPLAFGGLFGLSHLPVKTDSAATAGPMKNLEVALVLDNTGSMNDQGKIGVLRDATTGLIDQLVAATAGNPDRANALKLALVPFSMSVRLDDPAAYRAAAWMTGSPMHASYAGLLPAGADRFERHDVNGGWRGCVESRPEPLDAQEGGPASGSSWAPDDLYAPFTQPDGDPNAGCDLVPLKRLTSNTGAVRAAAQAMTAGQNTNVPLGLAWGWNALAPRGVGPFGDGVPYRHDKTIKSVILMTDGMNNIAYANTPDGGPYSGIGLPRQGRIAGIGAQTSSDDRSRALDARLAALCTAMKEREVVIYTVRLIDGPEDTLRGCATTTNHYHNVTRAEDLPGVFSKIAGDIIALRLSR